MEEVEVLKQYVEELGLNEKETLNATDLIALEMRLRDADENGLADYVERLKTPQELKELIVSTLYG